MLLGGIHEVIVKKLVNCTWQHLKLEAPEGTKARDCLNILPRAPHPVATASYVTDFTGRPCTTDTYIGSGLVVKNWGQGDKGPLSI